LIFFFFFREFHLRAHAVVKEPRVTLSVLSKLREVWYRPDQVSVSSARQVKVGRLHPPISSPCFHSISSTSIKSFTARSYLGCTIVLVIAMSYDLLRFFRSGPVLSTLPATPFEIQSEQYHTSGSGGLRLTHGR